MASGSIGAIGEMRVCADLLSKGFEVFRSVSQSTSCDLVSLWKGKPRRIEVRTGRYGVGGRLAYPKGDPSKSDIMAVVLHDKIVYIPDITE
jgi:hypothetical protein